MEMNEFGAVGRFGKSSGGVVGLTVVVEFESCGECGAFEMGTAPEGSPELGQLVSEARDEADALVEDGADGLPSASDSATWRALTARGPDRARCRRGVKRTQRARTCHRRARTSFSGDASRRPRAPARQGAVPLGTLAMNLPQIR